MSAHPITGVATVMVGGEQRKLAFDMNAAAALFDSIGDQWNEWLVARFLGSEVEGKEARLFTPLTPADTVTALHALLASDREDSGRPETAATLRRTVNPTETLTLQLAMLRVVMTAFGIPGEGIEAVIKALDAPRKPSALGAGTKR